MDVSPLQLFSVSTSLIPFLEHDDANRALMGSNMQRQAVPLLKPEAPVVSTGMEKRVAKDSGQLVLSQVKGEVTSVTGTNIIVTNENGEEFNHTLTKYYRSNQGTCINQRVITKKGDQVEVDTVLADGSSTENGQLALGQNVLVGFMTWEGYNYEDAIILSNRLIKDDKFTSIHIEKHEIEARDTKLGPEEITRDIPNIGEDALRNLDEDGVIRVGAEVNNRDILVGKITPKGETELSAEEKLLRAIFGEKARDVKDSSLYVPHGQGGKPDGTPLDIILTPIGVPSRMNLGQVLETHLGWAAKRLGFQAETPVFDSAKDVSIEDELSKAWLVEESKAISATSNLNPNVDDINLEILEDYLKQRGYSLDEIFINALPDYPRTAALKIWLKEYAEIDPTNMSLDEMVEKSLELNRFKKIASPILGKSMLYDGRSGEPFDQPITVGYVYMLKLIHLVEDKIHARATGPYSLITQQPLGGKAQLGGQRFGEMEVWALEAYSAAHNLREMLTIKSDDEIGRVKTYEAIVKGEDVAQPGIPQSFHVLMKELQSLGLSVELESDQEDQIIDESSEIVADPLAMLESAMMNNDDSNEDNIDLSEPTSIEPVEPLTSETTEDDTNI